MKKEILERIKKLGGNIDSVKGQSLTDDILSITFDTVLLVMPYYDEPISYYGIEKCINENKELFKTDKQAFYDKITDTYFGPPAEGKEGSWQPRLFTPFKEGSEDFGFFSDEEKETIDLSEITHDETPDFIELFYCYGYFYYICLSSPDSENPLVFKTDHEEFFRYFSNEGNLEDFLRNSCMTKDELITLVEKELL